MADGTGQRDRPGTGATPERSNAESLVKRRRDSWLRRTISPSYLLRSRGFHAKRWALEISFAVHKSGFESPLCTCQSGSFIHFKSIPCGFYMTAVTRSLWILTAFMVFFDDALIAATNLPSSVCLYHQKSENFKVIINLQLFVIPYSLQGCQ